MITSSMTTLVDVDANLLHPDLSGDIEHHLQVLHHETIYLILNPPEPVMLPYLSGVCGIGLLVCDQHLSQPSTCSY